MSRLLRVMFVMGILMMSSLTYSKNTYPLPFKPSINDKESLQRGAGLFMNYCSGCHSLQYLRYNRLAKDLGILTFSGEIDMDVLKNNLIYTKASVGDPIKISLSASDARQWFGIVPPDLTLKARERGAQWLYTYLNAFYADPARPFLSNNLLVKNTGMPDVLAPLSGVRIKREDVVTGQPYLEVVDKGDMSPQAFEAAVGDLVNFLVYVSEPVQLFRYRIGFFVMIFFACFIMIIFYLKRRIWRGV